MRRTSGLIVLIASIAALGLPASSSGLVQRRHPPAAGRAEPRPSVRRGAVVFIGGYFYDPWFGPYPWWQRPAYPYPYYPLYDHRAVLRVLATPDNAAVYVDGFYAGIVDDFNGFFEGLPLPPGGHEIVLYLQGYRTLHRRMYLAPGSTFKLHETMEGLPIGEVSEPPVFAPPLPSPPEGSFIPPRTAPRMPPPPVRTPEATRGTATGTLTLRVQPPSAEVWIDGERWASSDRERFVIQLPPGSHHIEVNSPGYRQYSSEIQVRDGETVPLNVSLTRERP
jgi:PEGA domain-containing protein